MKYSQILLAVFIRSYPRLLGNPEHLQIVFFLIWQNLLLEWKKIVQYSVQTLDQCSKTFMSPDQLIHKNSLLEGLWGKSLPKHIMLCFIFLIKTVIKTDVSLKLCCRNCSLEIRKKKLKLSGSTSVPSCGHLFFPSSCSFCKYFS